MATTKTLAGRIWQDPFIKIPTGSSREGIDELKKKLLAWDTQGNIELEEESIGNNIRIRVTFINAPTRPLGKASRKFYLINYLIDFLEEELKNQKRFYNGKEYIMM